MSIIRNLKLEHQMMNRDSNIISIFEKMGMILTRDNRPLTYEFIEKIVDDLNLPKDCVDFSLKNLKKYGYVSYKVYASGNIVNIKFTSRGIITYCTNFMSDFDSMFEIIQDNLINNISCTNDEIANKYKIPKPIVNSIIDYFDKKGYIEVNKVASGTITVYRVMIN